MEIDRICRVRPNERVLDMWSEPLEYLYRRQVQLAQAKLSICELVRAACGDVLPCQLLWQMIA